MENIQFINEAIDVSSWRRDEEFAEYPEGAREKTLLYCPSISPFDYLRAGHRYIFKLSSRRYAEQYWMEVFAYRLGVLMGLNVPPAFVAYDSKINQSGALIEWFLNRVDSFGDEKYVPGGDYCQQYIPEFHRKKGEEHNFETVEQIFKDLCKKHRNFKVNWKAFWATTFTFDALIGNTDRHQDNWGIIINPLSGEIRISPVFDNGTSLGHEISSDRFKQYDDENRLENYVSKGWHHMKWNLSGTSSVGHLELLQKLAIEHPETREFMLDCLKKVSYEALKGILDSLVEFDVPVRLSAERADFMLRLLKFRHHRLLIGLEK